MKMKSSHGGMESIDNFILPNKILCRAIGLVPERLSKSSLLHRIFIYVRVVVTISAINVLFVPDILLITANWGDIEILTSAGCVMFTAGQLLFKMCYVLWRRGKALEMYEHVDSLWKIGRDEDDASAIRRYPRQARLCTIIFIATAFSNNITFTAAAIYNVFEMRRNLDNHTDYIRGLPFDAWYGNEPMTWMKLKLAFFGQFIAAIFCGLGIVGLDTSMMTLILHMCGQFLLVKSRLRKIGRAIRDESRNQNFRVSMKDKFHREIVACIEHHKKILLIIEEVDQLLSPMIFVQFVTSGLGICLSGFALINAATDIRNFIKFTTYLLASITQLLIWCWPGEVLMRVSHDVGDTLYLDMPWYDVPNELKLDMGLVIARSQKECRVTAMKFQTMSIKTLGNVINTASSYFMLLVQMQGENL